jgi:protein-tyrosine phosphatase
MMIDFHAHLLPGLDDGVATMDEAVEVSRSLSEQGVNGVVVTPHVMPGGYHNPRERVLQALEELRRSLRAEGIPLRLYPGSEVYLSPEIPRWYAKGELLTLNDTGRYLLVELPYNEYPLDTGWVIDELLHLGVRTIIAHPERNGSVVRRPELLAALLRRNALAQVNAGSLMGLYGMATKRAARTFVRRGLVHLLGSDLHSAGRRSQLLPAAWEHFRRLLAEDRRDLYCGELPEQILRGEDARCPLPVPSPTERLASALRRFAGSRPRV